MKKAPAIFVGHGNPMNVLLANHPINQNFRQIAQTFDKPNAIVIISAHWYHHALAITANPKPPLMYDFYGFPKELYQVTYPLYGDTTLANKIVALLHEYGDTVLLDNERGFDHGVWSVLKHLYPNADIPVVQLSLDRTKPLAWHWQLAKKLALLRHDNVLIVGSGNIVHNLRLADFSKADGYDWAYQFQYQINKAILNNNVKLLLDLHHFGELGQLAIPTLEHYLPLLYVLATRSDDDNVQIFNDVIELGSISMTSIKVG